MTTLRCLDYRDCQKHGRSLFVSCHYIHCKAEGISPPTPPPLDEPIAKWMRKAICGIDTRKPNNELREIAHQGRPPSKTLTSCEQKVIDAMAQGHVTHGQIAKATGINKRSISRAIENALNRTGCDHVKELMRFARVG